MLDDYKDKQFVAYNLMMNQIKSNHISHAYLFDENNNSESFNIVISFIKEILCYNLNYDDRVVLCKRIDDGNYPEIKIIEPDGMFIKKYQILDLQQEFSRSAVEGNKRIYIIKDAEKMRSETANSMLKFLEEPDNNIIAILMSNNVNNLLPTIISRCQIIRLTNDLISNSDYVLNQSIINFISNVESKGIRSIFDEQELFFSMVSIKDRDKLVDIFDKMIDMYYDIMKIISGCKNTIFNDLCDSLKEIANKNSFETIIYKINYLIDSKDSIKNNVNVNLLIDSLIINLGGKNECGWS